MWLRKLLGLGPRRPRRRAEGSIQGEEVQKEESYATLEAVSSLSLDEMSESADFRVYVPDIEEITVESESTAYSASHSSKSTGIDEELSYLQVKQLEPEDDFLNIANFHLANVEDMHFSSSSTSSLDTGYFVHPLSGGMISRKTGLMLTPEDILRKQLKKKRKERRERGVDSDETTTDDESVQEEEKQLEEDVEEEESPLLIVTKRGSEDDDLLTFATSSEHSDSDKSQADAYRNFFEAAQQALEEHEGGEDERIFIQRILQKDVADFLDFIMSYAVRHSEDFGKNLSRKLDKGKIFNDLKQKLIDVHVETSINVILNRKAIEYFRRKKHYRAITIDPNTKIEADKKKLELLLKELDKTLYIKSSVIELIEKKTLESEIEEKTLREVIDIETHNFETLVNGTFLRDNFLRLTPMVHKRVAFIKSLRGETSQLRLTVIKKQHALAVLIQKRDELENIGKGLTLSKYQNLQVLAEEMRQKCEERKLDTLKLRARCEKDLHYIAHLQQKKVILCNKLDALEDKNNNMESEQDKLRIQSNNLKHVVEEKRRDNEQLSKKCGLLDNAPLLFDLDGTMSQVREIKQYVQDKKRKLLEIEAKLNKTA